MIHQPNDLLSLARTPAYLHRDGLLEMLSLVASHTDNAVIITDAAGLIEWANDSFTRISGYTLDEVRGQKPGLILQGPETDPLTIDRVRQAIHAGQSIRTEILNYHKHGDPYWVTMAITPIYTSEGVLERFIAIESDISAQKHLEQALRSALKDASDLSNAINQAAIVALTDRQGVIIDVNDRFCEISGYSRDEVIGQTHRIIRSDVHDQAFFRDMWRTIGHGHVWHGEICNRAKHGSHYWVDTTIIPFLGANGKPERYLEIRFDITERKQVEAALRDSENHYRSLVSALAEGIVLQAADGTIQACNQSAEQILGLSMDQLAGRSSMDPRWRAIREDGSPFPGEEHPAMVSLRTGKPQHQVIMGIQKPDQTLTWISINSQPIYRPGEPQPYAVVASFFDVTEKRQAEQEIQFQKTLLECQSEASIDGILVAGLNQRWLYANQRFSSMWGLDHHSITQMSNQSGFQLLLNQVSDPALLTRSFEALITNPAMIGHHEVPLCDGRVFECYTAPVREGSRIYGRVWYYRDITERKAIDRMKNEFISVVSHELRTPLTSIRGALGLIAGGAVGELPSKMRSMIDIALKNSDRLIRLINDILDIEKIESGQMIFNMQPTNLHTLVLHAIESNRAYGDQYGIIFHYDTILDPAWIMADADRIIQVITNLLSNAAKFSPVGSVVQVQITQLNQSTIRLSVADQGSGIPENFRHRIFQKFAQADSSSTRQQGGTGLGLSIAKAIIERHHGQISFVSTIGSGTTFFVDLPAWHGR
jgi:PAS domain S-box-containing protein